MRKYGKLLERTKDKLILFSNKVLSGVTVVQIFNFTFLNKNHIQQESTDFD